MMKKAHEEIITERELQQQLQNFGRRAAQLRKCKGWSQGRLTLRTGMTQGTITGVERGTRNITMRVMLQFIKGLDTTLKQFFDDDIFGQPLK